MAVGHGNYSTEKGRISTLLFVWTPTVYLMKPDDWYGLRKKMIFFLGGLTPGVGFLTFNLDGHTNWIAVIIRKVFPTAQWANSYAAVRRVLPVGFFKRATKEHRILPLNPNIRFVDCSFTGEQTGGSTCHYPDVRCLFMRKKG